jgi:hypothetical protein
MKSKNYIAIGLFVLAFVFSFTLVQRVREHATDTPPATDPVDLTATISSNVFSLTAPSGKVFSEISEAVFQKADGTCKLADPKKLQEITSKECLGKAQCGVTIDHSKIGVDSCTDATAARVVKVKGKAMSPTDWEKHKPNPDAYTDPIFGIVFSQKNYAYGMYGGIVLLILVLIVGLMSMGGSRQMVVAAPPPMYAMGRRRR